MASLGKCARCNKTVYQLEGVTAVKKAYHKSCFKCATCGWQLTLTNYKSLDDEIYCQHHFPVTGFGENHAHGKVETSASHIDHAMHAPKIDTVNQQIRGAGAGEKTNVGLDSMSITQAAAAPKLDTVNQQVKGELAGAKPNFGMDSIAINKATTAPKLDTVNQQVKGELAGSKPSMGMESISMQHATNAPKLDTVGGIHRGGDQTQQ